MSSNKRKTIQIKRPDETGIKKPQKPLPKVNVSESAAGASETDELDPVTPKTGEIKKVDPNQQAKGATMRVPLPDEDKIKKARKADAVDDEKLPGADEVMAASKNATAQIMIDTEDVQSPDRGLKVDETDEEHADQTMQIDTSSMEVTEEEGMRELDDEDNMSGPDRTMQIDANAFQTGEIEKALEDEDLDPKFADMTMKIDADALQTGDLSKALADADAGDDTADRTMQIDVNALDDAEKNEEKDEEDREQLQSQETMMMEPIPDEDVEKARPGKRDEKFNAATIAIPQDAASEADQDPVTKEEMEESFNAMTMAMDPNELQAEMNKGETQEQDNLDQTMDLTEQRPKTILIKRPSKDAPAGTPTVKTVRPDAQTVRTARPVAKSQMTNEQKADTSRVDIPTSEGKTVKLRRPAGAGSRPGAPVSSVASRAGLTMNEDGSVRQTVVAKAPTLGAGWLVVSIFTCLLTIGALWVVLAVDRTDFPMAGRLVDANNTLLPLTQQP